MKILLYEDNAPLRESLSLLFGKTPDFEVVGAFATCDRIVDDVAARRPDVVVLDIDLPGVGGLQGLRLLRQAYPAQKVIMLTVFDDNQTVFDCMRAGADGYLLKKAGPVELVNALRDVLAGGAPMTSSVARQVLELFARPADPAQTPNDLSQREREVLTCLVNGYSYKMIAAELFISLETVRSHIKHIYEKLQVNSKSEAVARAFRDRLV